ncbi:tubulin-binding protein [Pasteurellaceae bacterium RH1A]|nr:tubulin-binding protein [Pasteurellaceae bacterium RH1A]
MTETTPVTDQESTTTSTPRPTKKKSKLRWLGYFLLVLLILTLAPIIFLATGYGQRTALGWADKWVDGLAIGQIEGSLQEGLSLKNTQFVTEGVNVNVAEADLHIGFACLLDKQACVENLALKNPKIIIDTSKLPPSQAKENSEPLGEINLPIGVALKNLSVDNLQLQVDQMDLSLAHFRSGVSGQGKLITLAPTEVQGLTLSLAPSQTAEEAVQQAAEKAQKLANPPKREPIDWAAIKAQLAQPLLKPLEPIVLPLDFAIPQFSAKDINIEQKTRDEKGDLIAPTSLVKVASADLVAHSNAQEIKLDTLEVKSDRGNLSGQGLLNLSGTYPLAFEIKADSPAFPEQKIPASQADLKLSGELFGSTQLTLASQGAVKADLKGQVQLSQPKTPFTLELTSQELAYPFMPEKGQDRLKLSNLDLNLSGNLLNYQLKGGVKAAGMGLPPSSLSIKGQGEITHFQIEDLTLKALDGQGQLAGQVDWTDGVEWQSEVKLDSLNTKAILPDWAATLSGKLATQGFAGRGDQGEAWSVEVGQMDLKGTLMQKALQLQGQLTANHQTLLNVPGATLIYGENRIGLKGILGDKSDFQADIKAPNLAGLVPNLKASANGLIKLSGKVTEPNLDLDLTASNVSYDDLKLQNLTAKGKITTQKEILGDLEIGLKQFSLGEIKIEQANLTASGGEKNHTLKLTSKGQPVGANLQISGKFDRLQELWQGQLSNVAVQSPVGEWKNSQSVNVSYNNKQIMADISAHCWNNPKLVNICFPQAFKAGVEGKVPFEIKAFDLANLKDYLENNTQISGLVSAKGDAAWFKNKAPEVNVELNSQAIKVVQKLEGKIFPLSLTPVKIKANMANNELRLNTDIRIDNNGKIDTDVQIKDLAQTRQLSGNVNIDKLDLKLLAPLLTPGDRVNGFLNARLRLGGNATAPLLLGNLSLSQLSAHSNIMPFEVIGGGLSADFHGTSSTLTGSIKTKESELKLKGNADWKRLDAWHTQISAEANRFRVDVPNMAKVDVSPNIRVTATPKELLLEGKIDIPWARIEVEELPDSAVAVSSDEVIMDRSVTKRTAAQIAQSLPQPNTGMAVRGNVEINIGDDVRLAAYGLKTELVGKINVRQGSRGLGLYGQVNLKNGSFASFGQDLVIRKGVIYFAGLPSQPSLNIEAIRNPEAIEDPNVTAGVRVTGSADSPEVKIFSEPAMSQNEALSYIMTGRGLDSDGASSNSIAAALIGLSLSKSSKLVGGVGSAFGINDLSVTTAGIGDNTKVVVSGSLNPRFRVKYGVGIFAPLTELTLRYRLAPSLYLQWMSSVNQAVDLFYSFEFD